MIWKFLLVLFAIAMFVITGYGIDNRVKAREEAKRKEVEDKIDRLVEDENREV